MAKKGQAYAPSMSDAAVKARTGKDWAAWFTILDRAGAAKLDHKGIVGLLSQKHGVPGWWRQMVTVEYERARGLRAKHETTAGYSVSVSKTVAVNLPKLFAAATDAKLRKAWFPKGAFAPSSQTKNKYFRGSWNGTTRLEIGFYAKSADKSQIAVQVNRLGAKSVVETERAAWKKALAKLQTLLET